MRRPESSLAMESPVPSLAPSQSPSSMALCKLEPDSLRLAVARGPTHWRWAAAPPWTLPSPPLLSSTLSRVRHLRLTCCRLPCCRRPNRYRLNRRRPSHRRFSRLLSHPRPNHLRQSRLRQHHTYPIRCRRPCTNRPRRSRQLHQHERRLISRRHHRHRRHMRPKHYRQKGRLGGYSHSNRHSRLRSPKRRRRSHHALRILRRHFRR